MACPTPITPWTPPGWSPSSQPAGNNAQIVPPTNVIPSGATLAFIQRVCRAAGLSFTEAVIARLYFPSGQALSGFPANPEALASQWAPFVQWCQGQGVYNPSVLNEPDVEYPNQLWDPTTRTVPANARSDLAGLAQRLRADAPGTLYLGFPGSSGAADFKPGTAHWHA